MINFKIITELNKEINYKNMEIEIALYLRENKEGNFCHVFYITSTSFCKENNYFLQTAQENVPIQMALMQHLSELHYERCFPRNTMRYFFITKNDDYDYDKWLDEIIIPQTLQKSEVLKYLSINSERHQSYIKSILNSTKVYEGSISFYNEFTYK
jgi:hypothetical protein